MIVCTWEVENRTPKGLKNQKYVVGVDLDDEEVMVVFDPDLTHADIARRKLDLDRVVAAGFIKVESYVDDGQPYCMGESQSLKEETGKEIRARPEDTIEIRAWVARGMPQGG